MRSSTSYFLTLFLAKNSLATWQTEVVISGYWSYWHLIRAPSLASNALAITTADKFTKIKSIWFRNTKCIDSKHVTAFIIFVFFEWISLSRSNVWKAKAAWSSKKMKTITALRIVRARLIALLLYSILYKIVLFLLFRSLRGFHRLRFLVIWWIWWWVSKSQFPINKIWKTHWSLTLH